MDWSIHDFLTSRDGLGLDIAKDEATLEAVRRNILDLAGMPLDGLKGRRLNAQDFDRIGVSDLLRDRAYTIPRCSQLRIKSDMSAPSKAPRAITS